ncbi:unnamed protein product [Agarophyton chilense]
MAQISSVESTRFTFGRGEREYAPLSAPRSPASRLRSLSALARPPLELPSLPRRRRHRRDSFSPLLARAQVEPPAADVEPTADKQHVEQQGREQTGRETEPSGAWRWLLGRMRVRSSRRRWPRQQHHEIRHESASAYRTWLCEAAASSSRRHVRLACGVHTMTATPAGGDCGFHAIAWALLQLSGAALSASAVRAALARHVASHAALYAKLLRRQGHAASPHAAAAAVALFTRNVLVEGVRGHWLGQMWGEIELLALAKAFVVSVELYCFDVSAQRLRQYASFDEGRNVVRLLFTGAARAGHFDALLPLRAWC